jgi:prefoldin subunit 5
MTMGATAADVQAIRAEVQQLKNDMASIDSQYRQLASKRIEGQQKLAGLSQKIQQSSKDLLLVEDIVVITLSSETSAKLSLPPIENPAETRTQQAIPGKVSSADEAVKIYSEQKAMLLQDIEYRTMLRDAEKTMVDIYDKAVEEMLDVLNEYCSDKNLIATAQKIVKA